MKISETVHVFNVLCTRLVLRHDIYYYGCMSLLRSLDGKSIKMRTLMIDLPLPSFLVIFKGVETSTIFREQGEPYKLFEKRSGMQLAGKLHNLYILEQYFTHPIY